MVDAYIDAFEEQVQKRLAEARPINLSIFYEGLMKFKVNLITSLVALITVHEPTPVDELLFDMFVSEDPPPHAHGKRPLENNDAAE